MVLNVITCECGHQVTLKAHLATHRKACLGAAPTLEDLKRVGRFSVTGDGCWEWNVKRNQHGYGILAPVAAKQMGDTRVHRVALRLSGVDIPDGYGALHSCDNPPCFNPEHLRPGTQSENSRDAIERNRHAGWFSPSEPDQRVCPVCGSTYEVSPPSRRKGTCSRSCASKLSWRTNPNRDMGAQGGQHRQCVECGSDFWVPKASSRQLNCSAACGHRYAWRSRRGA